jgi:GNAT superfamily N-acetyltransferase
MCCGGSTVSGSIRSISPGYLVRVAQIAIRPARRTDIKALADAFGQEMLFTDRLGRMRHNLGELLVAWDGETPVGDVYLWCEPVEEVEVREAFPGVPMLNHLEVSPGRQGHGIGTQLIRAAEDAARRRGFDRIVLGVGVDNPDAKRLYQRLGYVDWGLGPVVARWTEPDGAGGIREVSLTCDTMVASLA